MSNNLLYNSAQRKSWIRPNYILFRHQPHTCVSLNEYILHVNWDVFCHMSKYNIYTKKFVKFKTNNNRSDHDSWGSTDDLFTSKSTKFIRSFAWRLGRLGLSLWVTRGTGYVTSFLLVSIFLFGRDEKFPSPMLFGLLVDICLWFFSRYLWKRVKMIQFSAQTFIIF